ncbi:MAG: AmmeMemoRadiSam system protein A [Acidobacteria bacterium]|nr:AmmeMemoRadiSam system protein A [Acidobacteriota bacterium]
MNFKAEQDSASSRSSAQRSLGVRAVSTPALGFDSLSLPVIARHSVETYVLERRVYAPDPVSLSPMLHQASACFVSVKTFDLKLRGCIGTITPTQSTLANEIIINAISAATRDPRFQPVSAEELTHLRYSVDVLDKPEPTSFEGLDPRTFGVIVEDETGARRGLLLPDINGIESAEQQLQIAARKACIALDQPHRLFRFRVSRFAEGT